MQEQFIRHKGLLFTLLGCLVLFMVIAGIPQSTSAYRRFLFVRELHLVTIDIGKSFQASNQQLSISKTPEMERKFWIEGLQWSSVWLTTDSESDPFAITVLIDPRHEAMTVSELASQTELDRNVKLPFNYLIVSRLKDGEVCVFPRGSKEKTKLLLESLNNNGLMHREYTVYDANGKVEISDKN